MRLGQLLRGLGALGALVALLGGVPYGLVRFVGWPLPRRVPSWHAVVSALGQHGISDTALIDILAIILWIAWAVLVLAVVVEALTMAQSRAPRRVLIAGHLQPLAGALLGAVVLSLAASFARSGSGVSLARSAVVMPIRPPNATNGLGAVGTNGTGPTGVASESVLPDAYLTAALRSGAPHSNGTTGSLRTATSDATYVVADGDTLWSIAANRLGDASRWPAIFELNRGVPQRDGGALDNPHWIYPGWVLRLPVSATATPSPERQPAQRIPEQRTSEQRTSPGPSGPVAPTEHVPASIADPIGPNGPIAPGSSVPLARTNPTTGPIGRPVGAHSADPGRPGVVDPGATDSRAAGRGDATDRRAPDHSAADHRVAADHGLSEATEHEPAIELSATDRVGGALVLAILGALVSLRLRRRQRYRPRAPRPGRNLDAPALTPTLRALLEARSDARAADDPFLDNQVSERLPLTSLPSEDGFAAPDRIEVGTSPTDGDGEGATVELALGSWPGLVLVGEGAEATLRAWLSALLARSGPYNVEVTTTTACAQRLFRGLDVPSIWPLCDPADVLSRAEGELIRRTRTFEERDVVDAAAFRVAEPAEPFPFFVVLLDELPDKLSGRWEALSKQVSRLGATTILLGGETHVAGGAPAVAAIDDDGCVVAVEPRSLADVLFGIRCFALSPDGAADLLAPIIAVHSYGGPDDVAADEEDRLRSDVIDSEAPADEPGANSDEDSAAPAFTTQDATDDGLSTEPAPAADTESSSDGAIEPEKASADQSAPLVHEMMAKVSSHRWVHPRTMTSGSGGAPTIDLHVLGMARAEAYGSVVDQGLRETAYALLGWFALRPEGATIDTAAEALWPGVSRKLGHDRFWTALGNARGMLGRPYGTESKPNDILVKSGNAYVPDAGVLDVDLWRFEEALHVAASATDLDEQAVALATALASYGGDYCSTVEGIWIEEARVDLHRRALDAAIALAEIYERRDRPSDAITALEWAVALDPICEEAVGRLVGLLGRLGHFDQARRVGDVLKGRLAEFDLDPGPATTAALVELRGREQAEERRRRRNAEGDGGQ